MFVREWLPNYVDGNQYKVILWGAAFGVLIAVYASLCYESPSRIKARKSAGGMRARVCVCGLMYMCEDTRMCRKARVYTMCEGA
jgi:hypothetical protein